LDAEPSSAGLESPEELREVILAQRRELDALKRETADVALLIDALDALLQLDGDEDPFTSVFAILDRVFRFSHALVLAERSEPGSELACIVATDPALVGCTWPAGRFFAKVLGGRVTATISSGAVGDWPAAASAASLSPDQPALYLPLGVRDRRALMVLVRPPDGAGFDRRDVALARKFSLLASHALATRRANRSESERRRLHQLTEELRDAQATLALRANYDVLTGLPNRAFFEDHVARALREAPEEHRLALAFIDLDGFKQVNDLYGHGVGDGLLTAVAERVRGLIRDTDMLARISGDEFVLLIDPVDGRAALHAIVERLLGGLKEAFSIDGVRLLVSASIGVAVHPDDGIEYDELRRNADMAMYSAKSTTKGSAAYFDTELGRAASERTELEQVLRRAVGERRFRSVLQPKVDLRTMQITGFEALARRIDDGGELRAPAEFIGPAANLGLLDDITAVVLDDVLDVLPALDARFGAGTSISINVSAAQATDPAGMHALLSRLAGTGRPARFVIELTEDAFLHAAVFQQQILPLFREFGVRTSIDDFGTGYASLSTLLHITAQELKIDRAFITGVHERPRSQVILQALATASRQLGLAVVAEGVETPDELEYLRATTPIQTAQGYLFAAPMPAEQLIDEHARLIARLQSMRVRDDEGRLAPSLRRAVSPGP
jgi:diguanylate cyclase (GGDEF)-like protein